MATPNLKFEHSDMGPQDFVEAKAAEAAGENYESFEASAHQVPVPNGETITYSPLPKPDEKKDENSTDL